MARNRWLVFFVALLLIPGFAAPVAAQVTTATYVPRLDPATGKPDPGTTTTNADGSTTTIYKDGWTKTTQADTGFGQGGSRETWKDPQGRIREIFRKDNTGRTRHHYVISEDATTHVTTVNAENYDAAGALIDATKEETKDGRTIKYSWDGTQNKWVAASFADAAQLVVDLIYARAFPIATALAAVGIVTMALIQTAKDAAPLRRWFQRRWVRRWLAFQWRKAAGPQATPEGPHTAGDDLVRLATGGDAEALFDLPIEQLCAQMNAASLIVLDYPWRHVELLRCLAAGVNPRDIEALLAARELAEKPRSQQTPEDQKKLTDIADPRNRVAHQIQRNIDALQIAAGFRWKLGMQIASIAISALIIVTGLRMYGAETPFRNTPLYILAAILSGFVAPVARDLVATLQQLRK